MRGIDIYGDDIAVIEDVNNYSECYEHCNERPDCRIWTYVEGSCYEKSENTFKADVNSSVVVGGIKDCQNGKKGNSLQFTFIILILCVTLCDIRQISHIILFIDSIDITK